MNIKHLGENYALGFGVALGDNKLMEFSADRTVNIELERWSPSNAELILIFFSITLATLGIIQLWKIGRVYSGQGETCEPWGYLFACIITCLFTAITYYLLRPSG